MIKMAQLREEIKLCLVGMDLFTISQLKETLRQRGYEYQVDYDARILSNAITSLIKQNYIAPADEEKKGNYRIEKNKMESNKEDVMIKNKSEQYCNEEMELREMRKEIRLYLDEVCLKMESILDSEKPSIYGRNRKTYDDILQLIDFLKGFEFTVED